MIMRKFNWKKSVAIALSTVCMVGALAGCGSSSSDNGNDSAKAEKLNGSITAAGSSALKPLVDDAADLFNEKYPDVNITIDAGGSGEGLKQVSEGTVNIGNSDVEAAEKLDATKASALVDHKVCVVTMAPIVNKDVTGRKLVVLMKQSYLLHVQNLQVQEQHLRSTHLTVQAKHLTSLWKQMIQVSFYRM